MKFSELGLSDYILEGLKAQGFDTPTEIQEAALPLIKSGKDVIGLSHTGSGKTYAFGIPALECIDTELKAVQVLIVCPTRELAAQEADDLRKLTGLIEGIKIVPIFGGSSMDRQVVALKKNAKIVIGTPGRLMDHLRRKTLKLNNLKMVILDEADEMLNMGFKEDIETILKDCPTDRQTIMFSATMPAAIMKLTKLYMKEPVLIKSKLQDSPQTFIKQYYINCNRGKKMVVLKKLYEKLKPSISIIFCNTKRMTEDLVNLMAEQNMQAVCLHGDMRQGDRKRVMENFKKSGGGILVATDVAARGIDIKNVDIVVNYDFPNNEDYYVHRIGRTGRAGQDGTAFTIIASKQQLNDLQALANKAGNKIEEYMPLSESPVNISAEVKKDSFVTHKPNRKFGGKQQTFDDKRKDFKSSDFRKKEFREKPYKKDDKKPFDKNFEKKSDRPFEKKNERSYDKDHVNYSEKKNFKNKSADATQKKKIFDAFDIADVPLKKEFKNNGYSKFYKKEKRQ